MNPGSSNIVITGIGLVTPLGNGREATWSRLLEGKSGILKGRDGLEARVFDFSPNGARSRMGDFALLAAHEAMNHAGLTEDFIEKHEVGCAVSLSKPLVSPGTLDPALLMSSFFGWSPEALIPREFHLHGPTSNVTAACATGIASLVVGKQWLDMNECDVVLAGAAESSLNDLYKAGFRQMGVLAEGEPTSVRPFDQDRSGFAMGEGAAVMVMEKEEFAKARGHRPLARLKSVTLVHNAFEAVKFDVNGSSVADLVRKTTGGEAPDYINAHGTGTYLNDLIEVKGLQGVDSLVSSTKAATGHLLGAAGAVEAAFCVLALRDQMAPPTINLQQPADDQLRHVTTATKADLKTTLSLSYGFGGQMGAVLFEKIS